MTKRASAMCRFPVSVLLTILTISQTINHCQKWPNQSGLVESLTPRMRTGSRQLLSSRNQLYVKLATVPSHNRDEIESLPYSTTTAKTIPRQKPLEERISAILEFVDNTILDSSSNMDTESILERVHSQHRDDFDTAKSSYLKIEERGTGIPLSPFSFERIKYPHSTEATNPTLAIRSMEPILDESSVNAVKNAAEDVWKAEKGDEANTSRFTYQYSGNSEAHVFDFLTTSTKAAEDSSGKRAISVLNEALQKKIYPTIREAFFSAYGSHEEDDGTRLFVYDALVIRYNSTKAAESAEASGDAITSAGQPLHRDLGLVSVNIMLNSAEDFVGGGTFFENQLLEEDSASIEPLKPSGIGYCLAHSASERHAGAGTTAGVRDILVLFVSACTGAEESFASIKAPAELLSARLKSCRAFCESKVAPIESEEQWTEMQRSMLSCRLLHQRLAVTAGRKALDSLLASNEQSYCDGEALQYLGTALMEYSGLFSDPGEAICVLEVAIECFEAASFVTPCDSRVYNNLGIILGTIDEMERKYGNDNGGGDDSGCAAPTRRMTEQETAYRKGLDILQRSIKAGCTNESLTRDLESLSLNYGLFVANQDRFCDAAEILEPVADATASNEAARDAYRLSKYCRDRCLDEHAP